MFGATGLFISIDYRNMGQKFISANNIVITSISPITNPAWVKKTNVQGIIKSRAHNSSLVNSTNTYTSASISDTTLMAGQHAATISGPYAESYVYTTYMDATTIASTSGSHSHSFTINLDGPNSYPDILYVGLYEKNSSDTNSLPIGTIIFAENIATNDLYGISTTSAYDDLYLRITTDDGLIGTQSSSVASLNYTTSSSGSHTHEPASGSLGLSTYDPYSPAGAEITHPVDSPTAGQSPIHSHTGTVSISQTKKYKKLRTYVVNGNGAQISNGMIFAFSNTSINLSPNWYCCNGQIINGYTTPNIVDRYILCGNSDISSHNIIGTLDTNKIYLGSSTTSTNDWTHNHGRMSGYQNITNYLPAKRYHDTASYPHNHGRNSSDVDFEPYHRNYIYCIYLP
jgi:hypothetical protein